LSSAANNVFVFVVMNRDRLSAARKRRGQRESVPRGWLKATKFERFDDLWGIAIFRGAANEFAFTGRIALAFMANANVRGDRVSHLLYSFEREETNGQSSRRKIFELRGQSLYWFRGNGVVRSIPYQSALSTRRTSGNAICQPQPAAGA